MFLVDIEKKNNKKTRILVKLIRESKVEDFVWQRGAGINIQIDGT